MVGIFRQKNPGNSLILLGYGLVLKFGFLLAPSGALQQEQDHYLYRLLLRLLEPLQIPDWVYAVVAFLLLFTQATLINRISIRQKMLPRPNFLPGMAFLLISTLFPEWNHFSAPLLVNTLLMFAFHRMINLYNAYRPAAEIFNIGLIMGLISLLYQPAVVYIILIPITLFIMRPFRVREWVIGILGITTPYYFLALEPLITNQWNWQYLIPSIAIDFPAMPDSVLVTVSIALLVLPFIVGGYFVQVNLSKMLIQIRKNWSLLLLFLIVSTAIILISGGLGYVNWMFGLMPLAFFHAAMYFYPVKKLVPLIFHWISFAYAIYLVYGW